MEKEEEVDRRKGGKTMDFAISTRAATNMKNWKGFCKVICGAPAT